MESKKCPVCGKQFNTNRANKKYCSDVCSKVCLKDKALRRNIEHTKNTNYQIFMRDNFKCIYCGRTSIEDGVKLVIEHIYPVSKGGSYDLFNVITACADCNNTKGDLVMDEETIFKLWQKAFVRTQNYGTNNFTQLKKKFEQEVIRDSRNRNKG